MISYPVPISLGSADSKGFQEPALSRQGDDDSAAVPHSLRPTEIEEAAGERCSHRAGDVWPTFGPVEAQSAETAGRTQCSHVDAKLGEKTGAGFRDLGGFVAGRDICVCGKKIGEVDAEATGKMVVANSGRAELSCLTRQGSVSRPIFECNGPDAVEHLDHSRRGKAEIPMPPVSDRFQQSSLSELRQMRAGGLGETRAA